MQQSVQHVDVALSVCSVPAGNEAALEMRWCRRIFVPANKSRFTIGVDRSVSDATRNGKSYARGSGGAHPRVKKGTRTTVQGKTVEHGPADDLDYGDIARAQDPFQPQVISARVVSKVAKLERYVEGKDLLCTPGNWNASCSVAITGMGMGSSGVALDNELSTPFVDLAVAVRRCASLNDGVKPHFMVMNETAASWIVSKGGRTSLPVDKDPREMTFPELEVYLTAHLGLDVYIETAREAGVLLWGNVIVFGYYPTEVVPTEDGFDVAPSTVALVHEEIPDLGIKGELYIKRVENTEKTGVMIAACTSYVVQKIDDKAILILTAVYS